jgi:hypothetical protein
MKSNQEEIQAKKLRAFHDMRDIEEIEKAKKKTWTKSIRVNAEEQHMIKELRRMLNLDMDGTALKVAAKVGYNVLHGFFGVKMLKYLTDKDRRRYIQE